MTRGDIFAIAFRAGPPHAWSDMDRPPLDERLPAVYRQILEVACELERQRRRPEALRARRLAAREYTTWDERAERRLNALLDETRRRLHPDTRPEGLPGRVRGRLRRSARSGSLVQPSA